MTLHDQDPRSMLHALRLQSGLNLHQLATEVGRSYGWLRARETGQRPLTPQSRVQLATALSQALGRTVDPEVL